MLLLVFALAADPPPRSGKLDPRPAARFAVGDALDQAVVVARRSTVEAAGLPVVEATRYAVGSKLVVTAVVGDTATFRQTVAAVELLAADPPRPDLADELRKLVGTAFEYTASAVGEVSNFRGPKDAPRADQKRDLAGNLTIRSGSALDADGWKELAALTLFAPAADGTAPDRPIGHDWGPLGSWKGRTAFERKGNDYGFRHNLSYRPPDGKDDGPLRLSAPRFAAVAAGGVVRFDPKAGRVTAADERFHARGTVTATVAGRPLPVAVDEEQTFQVRVKAGR